MSEANPSGRAEWLVQVMASSTGSVWHIPQVIEPSCCKVVPSMAGWDREPDTCV